ncbi:hypothetical protein ABZS77_26935 [Micromonospora sp. NPDC005298]|uniref:hypothetical protein n=1 Tax=Micromonospora sp. NPDC005298 TaxID=3156873 RepID=UPI0033B63590
MRGVEAATADDPGLEAQRGERRLLPLPQEYALAHEVERPRNVYPSEDALTDPLDEWLASAFTQDHLDQTMIG